MAEKRKKITNFGSLVHETIERIMMGEDPQIDESIAPSIDAFYNWYKEHKVRALDVERRIVSRQYVYAGNIDVLAEIDGRFGVLDIKTAEKAWDDHFIQTSAYVQAYNESGLRKAETHWILVVDQFGECAKCGARARDKGGDMDIKGGDPFCSHQWLATRGFCELVEVDDREKFLEIFLTARKLWELLNQDILAQIENYARRA